ncbi:hypothetical protein K0T92_04875 [Paenibacillus oenotherae]|uniref:DGQHR domain-containing protein n=1 Tax=Paenibacillus oenotherae TaxID=1435645 RepID=A0ABS7D3M6_9BACL|nr:DNA sulfur modification protein DndB [Paenibacillus oenotherae]MBW7474066.1 hypothetical protein [Paenibacillus oenotherae]
MYIDREILESSIHNIFTKHKNRRKFIHAVNEVLDDCGIDSPFTAIVSNPKELSSLDPGMLCLLTVRLKEQIEDWELNPADYYTDREIAESLQHSGLRTSESITLPYTIPHVVKLTMEDYVTGISGSELIRLYKSNLIEYDFETQRSPVYKETRSGIVEMPDVNHKSVKEIAQYMVRNDYLPDTITLNIYSEDVIPFHYDDQTKAFTIHEGARITILDGFHRLKGLMRAYSVNKNMDVKFNLSIKSYDNHTARRYFGRINKVNVVKAGRIKELLGERAADQVVREVQRNSELKGRISSTQSVNANPGHITTSEILADSIDLFFGNLNFIETKKTSQYLCEFFNYLLGYFPLTNKQDKRADPLLFCGYVWLAKYMQDAGIPVEHVDQQVHKINFDSKELREIIESKKYGVKTKKTILTLAQYFEKYVR